jgi:hypothetical protein
MNKLNNKQKALVANEALRMYIINGRFVFSNWQSMFCYEDVTNINYYESIESDIERYCDDIQLNMKAEEALI